MTEEFNLSDMIQEEDGYNSYCRTSDVKEFIKKLKEEISFTMNNSDYNENMIMYDIDKLAGENLIK